MRIGRRCSQVKDTFRISPPGPFTPALTKLSVKPRSSFTWIGLLRIDLGHSAGVVTGVGGKDVVSVPPKDAPDGTNRPLSRGKKIGEQAA